MQVLLIAEPGLPLTKNIAKILDSDRRITRADLDPRIKIFNIRQRLAHCAIYVDRSPSQLIINKLRDAGCPLILIAEEYYKSELFIPIDDFFTPQYLGSFCNNIVGLRSLHDMERDSFSMILIGDDDKEWDSLIAERSRDSIYKPTANQELLVLDYYEANKSTTENQALTEIEQKALDSWSSRENPKLAASKLNISQRTYYRMVKKAKMLCDNSTIFSQ